MAVIKVGDGFKQADKVAMDKQKVKSLHIGILPAGKKFPSKVTGNCYKSGGKK